ncbi:MAG: hypothetical protein Q7S08_02705 [bacterium]|nr:hypothetical protein [bacterium]
MSIQPENEEKIMNEKLRERFKALPEALQNAITSAEIEKKLRGLSDVHKLHLDQWQKLENEVMLALLGFQPVENLEANIKNEVGMSDADAEALAGDIADTIFEPIREELEKELGKPTENTVDSGQLTVNRGGNSVPPAPATSYKLQATSSSVQTSAQKIIEDAPPRPIEVKVVPSVASTPPAPPPTAKSVRAILSPAYAAGTKSHERTAVDDDPYREAIG